MPTDAVLRHLDLDHPLDAVWRLLTDDHGLASWMGEGSTIDPTPGGAVRVVDVEGGQPRLGRVTHVDAGRHLALRWWPEGSDEEGHASEVRFTLVPRTAGGTRLLVEERPLAATAGARACTLELVDDAWTWRLGSLLAGAGRSLAVVR